MKLLSFITSRLAWACTMAVLALVGLVSPRLLTGILFGDADAGTEPDPLHNHRLTLTEEDHED